jgi:hypothetical protein|tara:strand:+ start:255 stop:764 length:510 start_codon:yes stop_codon:yes gene_type:complete
MNDRIKVEFEKVDAQIEKLNDSKLLLNLATNINNRIKQNVEYSHFAILSKKAKDKANSIRLKQTLPSPISNSKLEILAYESVFKTAMELDLKPSARVIYWQLSRLGYAQTLVKQVCKSIANKTYQSLCANGLVDITAEYFVFNYAQHLIPNKVKDQLTELFGNTDFAHA